MFLKELFHVNQGCIYLFICQKYSKNIITIYS